MWSVGCDVPQRRTPHSFFEATVGSDDDWDERDRRFEDDDYQSIGYEDGAQHGIGGFTGE